jgi:hypothetical protein
MLSPEDNGSPPQEENGIQKVSIFKANIRDETAFFIIQVKGGFNSWVIEKRYSQFEDLHSSLFVAEALVLPVGVALPPKKIKLFVSHITPKFVEERRCLLDAYLNRVISSKSLVKSRALSQWLESDRVEGEEPEEEKVGEELPDDIEITDISIPSTRSMSDHVLYQIDVVNARKRKSFSKWTVLKRFVQIYEMDAQVRAEFVDQPSFLASLPAPPERKFKLMADHMDDAFVEQRRVILENYFQKMIKVLKVVRNKTFLSFVGVQI